MTRALRLLVLLLGLLVPSAALADLESDLQGLREKSYNAKGEAVEKIVAGGDERAVSILEAFLEGNLFLTDEDDRMVIGQDSAGGYRIFDALTGEDLGEVGKRDVSKIKINNKLRQLVKGSLGALTLGSRDPAARIRAADAVFRSTQVEMIPALEATSELLEERLVISAAAFLSRLAMVSSLSSARRCRRTFSSAMEGGRMKIDRVCGASAELRICSAPCQSMSNSTSSPASIAASTGLRGEP